MISVLLDVSILGTITRARGIGRYVSDLAGQLGDLASEHGVRMHYLCGFGIDGPHIRDDAAAAIDEVLSADEITTARWGYSLRLGGALASRRVGADIFHVPHTSATALFDVEAIRLVTCMDLIPLTFPEHYASWKVGFAKGRRWLDERRIARADHILTISHASAAALKSMLDVPASKISVVLLGLDHDEWAPLPPWPEPEPFVLYVGNADWRKNPTGMFRAVGEVRSRGKDVELVWAGRLSDGQLRRLREDAARYGASVRFIGYVDDQRLRELYRTALATLFVSRAEGFGYPVLESMALGCPVITSDRSSLPEVAGDAALLADPEQPSAIADAIQSLCEDPALRLRLREEGRQRAMKFTLTETALKTLHVYQQLAR